MKAIKKVKRFWKWYIKGDYHCDKCPYSWEERLYEGDCNCGCYIKGDIRDTCRLLPPFRAIIGKIRLRQNNYYMAHQYDGFGEFHEKEERINEEFKKILLERLFNNYVIFYKTKNGEIWRDIEGEPIKVNPEAILDNELWRIRYQYEDIAHPYEYKTLRKEWSEVIKRTWNYLIMPIRPFLPERKERK